MMRCGSKCIFSSSVRYPQTNTSEDVSVMGGSTKPAHVNVMLLTGSTLFSYYLNLVNNLMLEFSSSHIISDVNDSD